MKSFIFRLSSYYRAIENVGKEVASVSSYGLAELSGVNAPQVRKDLGQFGQFGIRGRGYPVVELKKQLQKILGLDRKWCMALVGVGHLGSALLSYPGFRKHGFEVCFAFDNDLTKIGKTWAGSPDKGIKIQAQSELKATVRKNKVKIAILTVPNASAQSVTDVLIDAGIKGIVNFAPVKINVPAEMKVVNVDLSTQLEALSFYLSKN